MQRFRELKTIIISRQLFSYQSSTDPRIAMMRELFKPQPKKTPAAPSARSSSSSLTTEIPPVVESVVNLVVFDSDESSDESANESNEDSHNAPVAPVLTSSTLADPASAMPEPLLVAILRRLCQVQLLHTTLPHQSHLCPFSMVQMPRVQALQLLATMSKNATTQMMCHLRLDVQVVCYHGSLL